MMPRRPRLGRVKVLLVDSELGSYGLGRLAAHLPACEVWPAAKVASMQAAVQADATLAEIEAADVATELVVGIGSGATVAAALLASGRARRALLIDPVDHLTHDEGFERAFSIDQPPPGPVEGEPVQRNIERITAAIAARRAGDLVSYYQWVVETTSDVPAIRDAYLEALALADADRQPYDEALALTSERWAELDWLATLRRCAPASIEIWFSRLPRGRELPMTAAYLRRELPGAKVSLRNWDRYGHLIDAEPWARALRVR